MARMSEFTFLSSDGQTALSAREYLPEGDPVGIAQIVHGIAEHIARYDAFAAFLAEHGYIVVLHDQLGHGKSAPDEAHLGFFSEENGWEKAVQDIRSLHDMMNGIAFVTQPKNIARMKKDLPILFVSGDCDPVGEQGRGVIRAYKCFLKAGMKDVTMKLYHGGRHEMLNETNRAEVYEDVLSWLNSKTGK